MNDLERAAVAMREHPSATAPQVEVIERRAGELTRRRRVGWTAAVVAVVVLAALIGIGTLRSRADDQSIVVGPSPEQTTTLTMALHGVPDQVTADQVAETIRERIERLSLDGTSVSNGRRAPQYDPRVAIDMAEVRATATPTELKVTAPTAVVSRLGLAPALWSSGHSAFVVVRSDAALPENGVCPVGTFPAIGIDAPRCYAVDSETYDPAIDGAIERTATATSSGDLLIGWDVAGFDNARLRALGDACSQLVADDSCPTHEVAIRTADDRLGLFKLSPATPPGMPYLLPVNLMSFDESLAWAAMLTKPLPAGVTIDPPPVPDFVTVVVARAPIPAGSLVYIDGGAAAYAPIARAALPASAVTDRAKVSGRTATVDIPAQSVITEEMVE